MNRSTLLLLILLPLAERLPAQVITWISACTDQTFCLSQNGCVDGNVVLTEVATTSCFFGNGVLDYSYKIDLFNNGGIELQASNDTCSGLFPKGTHRIYWRVNDNCGNIANCSYLFTVKDCTPPSLLCINGLTQNLESPGCFSTFNVSQFVLNYSDNCTPNNLLEFGIRKAGEGTGFPTTTSVSFGECNLGLNIVEVWIRDANGLMNICQNYVLVQQNGSLCECNPDGELDLHGCVHTAGNKKLNSYSLRATLESLAGVQPPLSKTVALNMTDSCFTTSFAQLPFGGQYRATLRAQRTNAAAEGLSTFDLVLMSKHVLGIDPFPSVYQWLAADVNKSNTVTTFDIVETRKLLLGIYDTFPASPSWRFVRPLVNPADFGALAAVKDTYQIILNSLSDDLSLYNFHFIGIKMGDANLSASFGSEPEDRSGPLLLRLEDRVLAAGETATVPVRLCEAATLSGWQLALQADPALLQIEGLENLPAEDFVLTEDGVLRALWFDGAGKIFAANETLFYLKIKALQPMRLSEALTGATGALTSEAYIGSGNAPLQKRPLALRYGQMTGADVQVFALSPNPCRETATLGIQSDTEAEAMLTLLDATGKLLWQQTFTLAKGYGDVTIPTADLPAGIFAWRLQAGDQAFAGRLVKN